VSCYDFFIAKLHDLVRVVLWHLRATYGYVTRILRNALKLLFTDAFTC